MDYVGTIYRPPSEARSLLLQVTEGCSHNRCAYCDMYRDKRFRVKDWDTVQRDIEEAAAAGPRHRKLFLCDGDALIMSTRRLLQVLAAIRDKLPWIERVGTYGDTRSVGRKSVAELRELRDAGLGIVYHGMESGDDPTLAAIDKGGTRAEIIDTAHKLNESGLLHSVIVLLGIGGKARSAEHARETASALTQMDPPFVGALTTTVLPGTPLYTAQSEGRFELPGKFDMIRELRTLVAESKFSNCRFSSNHASNYLPVQSSLPRDRDALVELLDRVLANPDERRLKPESLRAL